MRPHVLMFEKPPSFNDLVARARTVMMLDVMCDCTGGTIWEATNRFM
jgi:hypothetical protein